MMMSKRNSEQAKTNFVKRIDQFIQNKSYLRSFAYETIPVYGWFLQQTDSKWNSKINSKTDLTELFIRSFEIQLPADPVKEMMLISERYGARAITIAETEREEKINSLIAAYKSKFLEKPHLTIVLEKMNMSFDYLTIMPLEEKGTVYPTVRVTDNWGILDVSKGALISADWKSITVSMPEIINGQKISGDGWTLELKDNYLLQKDQLDKNYLLNKK
jgi:hypothetical protein